MTLPFVNSVASFKNPIFRVPWAQENPSSITSFTIIVTNQFVTMKTNLIINWRINLDSTYVGLQISHSRGVKHNIIFFKQYLFETKSFLHATHAHTSIPAAFVQAPVATTVASTPCLAGCPHRHPPPSLACHQQPSGRPCCLRMWGYSRRR